MVISFGAPQVWLELAQVLEDPEWTEMLGEFGWFYSLSPERKAEESNGVLTEPHFAWPMFASTMMAFAGRVRNDQAISQRAWQLCLIMTNRVFHCRSKRPLKQRQRGKNKKCRGYRPMCWHSGV